MIDKNFIRENPEKLDKALFDRGLEPLSKVFLDIDTEYRKVLTEKQELEAQKNANNKKIETFYRNKQSAEDLKSIGKMLDIFIYDKKNAADKLESKLNDLWHNIPNIPDPSVPTTLENQIVKSPFFDLKNHDIPHEIIGKNYGLEIDSTVSISGTRYVSLTGELARLERKLINFMLDHNIKYGFNEISHPAIVKSSALFGTGNFPKFKEDVFSISDDQHLIPTSEVFLTNLVANKVVDVPIRYTAVSPCFRSEVGSAGKDLKGLIRLHQFSKVELVSIVEPDNSSQEHEMMINVVEELLKKLELPYRIILLSTKDMGFSSSKTYDFEVWFPSQKTYREISSISNCKDFQARRINSKYMLANKSKDFVHTLNGSSLAIGRTIAALLENHYTDGKFELSISI